MISPVNPSKLPRSSYKARAGRSAPLLGLVSGAALLGLLALALRDGCSNPHFASYGGVSDCLPQEIKK